MTDQNLVGRYIKALIDKPHGGAVKAGEYGIITDVSDELIGTGHANFPSQSCYSFYQLLNDSLKKYELMPEGWSPVVPKYVKCIKATAYCLVGKVYKTRVTDNNVFQWYYEPGISSYKGDATWDGYGRKWHDGIHSFFVPSTKAEYYAQFADKEAPLQLTDDWCVKLTQEIEKDLFDFLDKSSGIRYNGSTNYYGYYRKQPRASVKSWGKELTVEQFYKHFLPEKQNNLLYRSEPWDNISWEANVPTPYIPTTNGPVKFKDEVPKEYVNKPLFDDNALAHRVVQLTVLSKRSKSHILPTSVEPVTSIQTNLVQPSKILYF